MDRNLGSFIVNRSKTKPTYDAKIYNSSNTSENASYQNKEFNTVLVDKTKGAISKRRPMSKEEENQNKSSKAGSIY